MHGMLKPPSEPHSTAMEIKAVGSSKNVITNSLHEFERSHPVVCLYIYLIIYATVNIHEVMSKPRRHV